MANDIDMMKDIDELQSRVKTKQQGYDLNDLYFYKYIELNENKLEQLKKLYIKKYGSLDNYVWKENKMKRIISKIKKNLFYRCQGNCRICFDEGGCKLEKDIKKHSLDKIKKLVYDD